MKNLALLALASLVALTTSARGDNLKPDVEKLLMSSANATKPLPPDFDEKTMGEFTEFMTKKMNLELSDVEAGKLAGGGSLREPQEFEALLKEVRALGVSMAPFSSDPVFTIMAEPTAAPRSREAAYRLLSLLRDSRKKDLVKSNLAFAKLLFIDLMSNKNADIKQLENYELSKFKDVDGTRKDWLYQADGFGTVIGKAGNEKVTLLAPKALFGDVIAGFDNGSVRSIPMSELEKAIQLPEALKLGNAGAGKQPAAPAPVSR